MITAWRVLSLALSSSLCLACPREFVRYYPSEMEEEWISKIDAWQQDLCTHVKADEKRFKRWYLDADAIAMENENRMNSTMVSYSCSIRSRVDNEDLSIFSKMEYIYNCPKMLGGLHGNVFNESIEPLAGFLRDSSPVCFRRNKKRNGRVVGLEDKNFILFSDHTCNNHQIKSNGGQNWRPLGNMLHGEKHREASPKLIIVDLGATLYYWSLSGPSQKYLLEKYLRSGYSNLYRMLSFEANVYQKQKKIFQGVPPSIIPHYQYFNVPITSDVGSKYNPLTLLKAIARPRDFVSFKLDVDNSEIEFALLDQIISDPSISSLIDELFFEHHSNIKEFQWAWKEQVRGSMSDGYKYFRKLRELGIRAHSWI